MTVIASGMHYVDLNFLGRRHAIATAILAGRASVAIVDPGPSTCLQTVEEELNGFGIRPDEVTHVLLTHIHLDHAGATGTFVKRHPHVKVVVHQRGAPHVVDPSKLLESATRLYGTNMERLWGEVLPVPAGNVMPVTGGERIEAGGRRFEVAYTPGHAAHHVSYFDADAGVAFVGDTAGICIDDGYVLPPTPPPDIDPEQWKASAARIEAWDPQTLFLTHFGPTQRPPRAHLQSLLENLETTSTFVRLSLREDGTDEERRARFAEQVRRELRRGMTDEQMASYGVAAPLETLWLGLARYWRQRA